MEVVGLSPLKLFIILITIQRSEPASVDCHMLRQTTQCGFHRELTTDIKITTRGNPADLSSCDFTLVESIPSGMYADLHELKSNEEFGGPKVYSPKEIDVEKPEYLSPSHTLYIYGNLSMATVGSTQLQWSVTIPVHLRYHRPQIEDHTATVILKPPILLLSCPGVNGRDDMGQTVKAPCCDQPENSSCQWVKISCSQAESLTFSVPVGQQEHRTLVIWGTLVVTVGATLFLCYIIYKQPNERPPKPDKKRR